MKTLKYGILLVLLCICFSSGLLAAEGSDVIPEAEYSAVVVSDLPEVLKINEILEWNNYRFQVIGQPVVTKSNNSMIAERDLKFLIVRMEITNLSEQTVGWLMPEAFHVRETYFGHVYGTYSLDSIISAKAAAGFGLPVFYSPMAPGEKLRTVLVFDVYPEAQSWVFTFSPVTFGSESNDESVSFQLPDALMQ